MPDPPCSSGTGRPRTPGLQIDEPIGVPPLHPRRDLPLDELADGPPVVLVVGFEEVAVHWSSLSYTGQII
jgi:hypothetical protein